MEVKDKIMEEELHKLREDVDQLLAESHDRYKLWNRIKTLWMERLFWIVCGLLLMYFFK
jgi:hypothetical protein